MATEISTLPANINYTLWKGDTWEPGTITVYDGSATAGNEVDFSGATGKVEIRQTISNGVVKTLTSPSSGITLSSSGVITLTMTEEDTAALSAGEYKYDLQVTFAGGSVKTYSYGRISVKADTTA